MPKINELREELARKNEELNKKVEARDVEGAKQLKKELDETRELLKIAEDQETRDKDILVGKKEETRGKEPVSEMRSIVKSIMGKELTAEERATIKTTDNAAVLPKQFINQLQEIKKGYGSLLNYCDIIPVSKNSGTIPVVDLEQNELPVVAEGDNITEGTLVTTDLPFTCVKHGLIQSLTSELVEDAEIEIENICKKNFAELATRVENTKIATIVSANATDIPATGYADLETTMDKALPAVKAGLVTLTNSTGYAYLKNKKDSQGRPLNLVTEKDGKYYFNGKELLEMDDTILAPVTEGKNYVFYSLNMKEAIKVTPRKGVTVARSTEAGFSTDTIKLRVLERIGIQKGSTRSIKRIEF